MTTLLDLSPTPLDLDQPGPSRFASPSVHPSTTLKELATSLRRSKRIVVICGVSTAASIPDFRGAAGLFSSDRKGKAPMKDLFHIKALASPSLLAAHHALINELAQLSLDASPTPFHLYLSDLDNAGRLLRVYTQNIDGLEEKAGVRYGLPSKPVKGKGQGAPTVTPRAIPLHGSLSTLSCPLCHLKTPLAPYLPLSSSTIPCPACDLSSTIRSALSERKRRTGSLRADVVLYGEEHPQGDLIGAAVERDIKGTGGKLKEGKIDFLLVAGTSLAIPGVKRMVKEMSKAAKGSGKGFKSIFVNDEPPKNVGEWAGVFDVWVRGDVQEFVKTVQEQPVPMEVAKPPRTPKKRKAYVPPTPESLERPRKEVEVVITTPSKKRKVVPFTPDLVGKNAAVESFTPQSSTSEWLLTPRATPSSPRPSPLKRPRTDEDEADDGDETPTKKPRSSVWGSTSPLTDVEGA